MPILTWHRALKMMMLAGALLGSVSHAEAAGIYRSLDSKGNVIFTDRPSDGAETVGTSEKQAPDPREAEQHQLAQQQTRSRKPRPSPLSVAPDGPAAAVGDKLALTPAPEQPVPQSVPAELQDPVVRPPVYRLEILNPDNGSTLIDPVGKFWVELQSYPTPVDQTGLTAELWMDGQLVASGDRPTLGIPAPESGTHELVVRLVDHRKQPVIYSPRISVNIRERR